VQLSLKKIGKDRSKSFLQSLMSIACCCLIQHKMLEQGQMIHKYLKSQTGYSVLNRNWWMESEMPEHFHKLTGELLLELVLVLNMNWEVMKGRNKMPEQDC
jgi:hypothetical protein